MGTVLELSEMLGGALFCVILRQNVHKYNKDMSELHREEALKSFSHQNIPKPHALNQGIQDADSRHLKQQLPFLDKASSMTLAPNRLGKLPGRPRVWTLTCSPKW